MGLDQRASSEGRLIIKAVVDLLGRALPDADGPNWGQKFYISWKDQSNRIWAQLNTGSPNVEYLDVKDCPFSAAEAAHELDWELFDVDADLKEKLALGSSVKLQEDGGLRFGIKAAEDVSGQAGQILEDLLKRAWSHEHVSTTGPDASTLIPPIPFNSSSEAVTGSPDS